MNLVKSTFNSDDVTLLLKDLSGKMVAMGTSEREKMIQSGTHYSEMLPLEYKPTEEYMKIYNHALNSTSYDVALGVAVMAERMYSKHGKELVIISLARAGIPIGILAKRYIKLKYNIDISHYAISIIRGKGIDINAMNYIASKHSKIEHFQFLDGWTGKGAIKNQLNEAVDTLKSINSMWNKLSSDMAVLADPAHICEIVGTYEDFLIPSSCLNGTITGLISRTVLRDDLVSVESGDFHGAVYFESLKSEDKTAEFLDKITLEFAKIRPNSILHQLNKVISERGSHTTGIDTVRAIAKKYDIDDINLIKPGVGEATRVLLRRVPWKVLINTDNINDESINHIIRLCKEKDIPIEEVKLDNYKVCGIIKNLSADA